MAEEMLTRAEVEQDLTWNLNDIFSSEEEYKKMVEDAKDLAAEIEEEFKGNLNSAENINTCLDKLRNLYEMVVLTGNYASLAVAVDQTNEENQKRQMKQGNISSEIESKMSFIESEIIQLDEEIIKKAMEKSEENRGYLKEILRGKEYVLPPSAEKVLAALSNTLDAPYKIYNQAKLADMDFGKFEVDGEEYPLSFVLFEGEWEFEEDTKLRRKAFKKFSNTLRKYQNTIATNYQTQVQKEKTIADQRGHDSVIDYLLFDQEVDKELYNRQIDLIMEKLAPHMRKYAKLLQRIHGLDEMTFADLKLSVDSDFEPEITINEAKNHIKDALSVMGDDYLEMVENAFDERWIDFVQNKGKSTGAFCSTPYGKHPYVLISWTAQMREAFVLAHELGHAGHFYLAQQNQNIFDTRPSLYFIEAPSTMNEMLMTNYLMDTVEDKRMKRWVLSTLLSRTYYHNFVTHLLEAHYQRKVYQIIEDGGSVQAPTLNKLKRDTLEEFWGDAAHINEGAELTWMRQPHYYMGLYPYTYSAGLTISTEASKRIKEEGQEAVDDWREVLKAGGTKKPVELAKMAGVDITTEKPLLNTIDYIGEIIDEIIELTEEIDGV
ncbi:MAG TPA: oligoendopeptidase F [Halanaerobiales bacterium]|nr:oligoendopeptidase F [Halanaerobiales bacterium]